jgi:hypothetical protein
MGNGRRDRLHLHDLSNRFFQVANLFTWDDEYFDQPLPQLAIDREGLSAHSHFFLEFAPARRRNTIQTLYSEDFDSSTTRLFAGPKKTRSCLSQPLGEAVAKSAAEFRAV